MGRRKEPQTRAELEAEKAHAEKEIWQLENQQKILANQEKQEMRKLRTRRLIETGGKLEHFVPELKDMSNQEKADFIKIAVSSLEAQAFLRKRGEKDEEKSDNPDTGEN